MKQVKLFLFIILFVSIFPILLAGQTSGGAISGPVPQIAPQAEAGKSAEPVPAEKSPNTVTSRYVELWNTGNFDQIQSLFSPPVAMVSRGNRVLLTLEMLKRVVTAWRKSMPDLNFKIEDTISQGDMVAMRLSFTGSYKERLFPGTATPTPENPRTVRATEMLMFHLKDGKINQIWEEYDENRMHLEMGGSWRTNQELETAASQGSRPAATSEPATAPPAKP